jgi:arylsulfatase A-like enzyme
VEPAAEERIPVDAIPLASWSGAQLRSASGRIHGGAVVSTDRTTHIDAPVPQGGIRLRVCGSASVFDDQGAVLEVRNGGEVLGRLTFPEGRASTQELILTELDSGRVVLDLVFVNDEVAGARDRNLDLERVDVLAAGSDESSGRLAAVRELLRGADVVVVSIDTLRADHIGSYGYGRPTSPNIDALAETGTVFEHATSTSTWTLPSHASLLTGLYPDEHGVNSYRDLRRIPDDVPTLAAAFRESGYATGGFAGGRWVTPRFGFDRGFDVFENDTEWAASIEDYAHRGETAARWVESLPPDQGYFLFVHYYQVHAPYWSPAVTRGRFLGGEGAREEAASPFESGAPTAADLEHQIRLYDEDIAAVDIGIGALLHDLHAARPDRPPLVVLTADHGEEFFEHGGSGHGQPHREVLSVPLIVSHPQLRGLVEARIADPVDSTRVAPTIADLVGLEERPFREERSAVSSIVGSSSPSSIAVAGSGRASDGYRVLWRRDRHVVDWRGRVRVYDVSVNPHEDVDLTAGDARLGRAQAAELDRAFGGLAPEGTWQGVELDPTTTEQLRALGYLR